MDGNMSRLLQDPFGKANNDPMVNEYGAQNSLNSGPYHETKAFYDLLRDAHDPLWEGKDKANDDFCSKCGTSRWKNIEDKTTLTKKERRRGNPKKSVTNSQNIRFAMASDGFNPFGTLSSTYGCWPVVLISYNLPSWLCMKASSIMRALIIPGPSYPGKEFHVFMETIYEELFDLFEVGTPIYDASRNELFQIRATTLFTISDYVGIGIFARYSVNELMLMRLEEHIGKAASPQRLSDVSKNSMNGSEHIVKNDHRWLARGPIGLAKRYRAFNTHGFQFRPRHLDGVTQNSGVVLSAKTSSYTKSSDTNPILGDLTYYGRVIDIIELNYSRQFLVALFKCEWVDVVSGKGVKKKYGYTLVNFSHLIHTGEKVEHESFIFPNQAD
uniref:DUF4216 domain-containing protein n=1 Tax=Oryza brachyantha TaxID=4533 RepID=J3MRS0_ORYBR